MHMTAPGELRRERFFGGDDHPARNWERVILAILLAQDGSTTRLLEAITGERIRVHIIDQQLAQALPAELDGLLPGKRFLRRLTSLEVRGQVLLDSLSYIALEVLPPPVVKKLEEGTQPIGHVLRLIWTRRKMRHPDAALLQDLWRTVGLADAIASRTFCIETPRAPCLLLAETFRRGVLAKLTGGAPPSVEEELRIALRVPPGGERT